jgi:hypothetical protein
MAAFTAAVKPGILTLPDPTVVKGAKDQWLNDRSGPLAEDIVNLAIGYLKLPVESYPEYSTLDPRTQALLSHPNVPAYEEGFVCFVS